MKKEWIVGLGIGVVLAVVAVLLFARWWGGHFILHTLDFVVETLASRSGWSPDLVRGVVILATIPFFWAVARYTWGLFIPYASFDLYRNRYGMIIVAYVGLFFVAKYVASRDAYSYKWCDNTPEGIRVFDGPGTDPVYGIPLHPCTMEERITLRQRDSGIVGPPQVRTGDPHFDTATGQPLQNYYKDSDGRIELFPLDVKVHPRFGVPVLPITPEIASEYEKQPSQVKSQVTNGSGIEAPPPSPEAPRQSIVDAPQAIEVGDFVMSMQECNRPLLWPEITKNGVRCDGSVENKKNRKIRLTISGGRIITDKRDEYNLSAGPYLFGQPGMFQLGGGCCSEELITDISVPLRVWLHDFNPDATATNLILEFTSTGNPSQGEVVFKRIPVHGESL